MSCATRTFRWRATGPEVVSEHFRSRYPLLFDFFTTTLWEEREQNVIDLLVRVTWNAHPQRASGLQRELADLATDTAITPEGISQAFNHQYSEIHAVVTAENAVNFCRSMAETLAFICQVKPTPSGRHR